MKFDALSLDDRLQQALATAGFVTPTPIQAAALPVALAGRDLVGTAQTGTGKTAAFVLPILQHLIAIPLQARKTRAIILAPTRELVEQILAVIRELGAHTNIRAVAVYGGIPMQQQTRALRSGVEIVVACPGRLLDHIQRRNTDLRQLDYLVLDEADRMLDMGFIPSIQEIIEAVPATRQTMLFSATFPKSLNMFVEQTLRDPVRVAVDTAVPARTVRHTLYQVKHGMKADMLTRLLRQLVPDSDAVLIFTQMRVTANEVVRHLRTAGMDADVLHAEKTQRERQDTLDRFRAGAFPYLVATDIAARGIDVTSISHVINFDLPQKANDYLHRIGRTGRMERTGHAISLMTRGDIRAVCEIERMLGKKIEVARLEESDGQLVSEVISTPHDGMKRPPTAQEAAPATHRPPTHHQAEKTHPRRTPYTAASAEPARPADRPERTRRAAAASLDTDRPQRRRRADAPATQHERPRKQSGSEHATGQSPRSTRPGRPPRERGADLGSKRRTPSADNAVTAPSRQERPHAKRFTGMGAVAEHRRQHTAGKRQPGEVPATPRPQAKAAPLLESTAKPSTRAKRSRE